MTAVAHGEQVLLSYNHTPVRANTVFLTLHQDSFGGQSASLCATMRALGEVTCLRGRGSVATPTLVGQTVVSNARHSWEALMRSLVALVAVTIAVVSAAGTATRAHHSFAAEYDRTKPITLKGTVTRVEWQNPHIYFYLDVKGANGVVENWAIEGGAPNTLYRAGWRKDSLQAGNEVTVEGWLAKSGARLANMRAVVLADGRSVLGGSSGGDQQN
jgi:Family of unknown function (DUF6152)